MKTVTRAWCITCDWQPDPERRKGIDAQAEEHSKDAKHVVVTSTRPLSELIEDEWGLHGGPHEQWAKDPPIE